MGNLPCAETVESLGWPRRLPFPLILTIFASHIMIILLLFFTKTAKCEKEPSLLSTSPSVPLYVYSTELMETKSNVILQEDIFKK